MNGINNKFDNKANNEDLNKLFQLMNTKIGEDVINNLQHIINKKKTLNN